MLKAHGGALLGVCFVRGRIGCFAPAAGGRDGSAVGTVGCEYAVVSDQVDAGLRCEGGEPGQEIKRFEEHMGGAIAVRCFEFRNARARVR